MRHNLEVLLRELALLAVLCGTGAGIALQLREVGPPMTRLALAPAFGLAALAGILGALNFFVPLEHAFWWAILPLAVASLALALRTARREGLRRPTWIEIGAPLVVLAIVLLVFSLPLIKRDSFGPIGYGIFDGPGYLTLIDGYANGTSDAPGVGAGLSWSPSWQDQRWDGEAWGAPWDISQRYGWAYKWQHTAAQTIPAAVAGATGWSSWTLVSTWMIALVAAGALATWALAAAVGAGRRWAVLAGALYAGPMLFQLHIDGSSGLLSGLCLLPAMLLVGQRLLQHGSLRLAAALGLLFAGLQAVYPENLLLATAAAGIALVAHVAARRRRGRIARAGIVRGAAAVGVVALLAIALAPRATPWTYGYIVSQLGGGSAFAVDKLIDYNMDFQFIPGWIVQTREFYSFAFIDPTGSGQVFWGVIVPLLMGAVVALGLVWRPPARIMLALLAAAALQALVAAGGSYDCSYCVQRSLLSLAPVAAAGIAVGLAALSGRVPLGGIALAAVLVVGVATSLAALERRAIDGAYLPSPDLIAMEERIEDVPGAGPLLLEGFDATPLQSWGDLPVVFPAMRDASGRRIAVPPEHNDWGALSYPTTRPAAHPAFTPEYELVLSRIGGVDRDRETIARQGPLALQRRAKPFDAIVVRGIGVDTYRRDRAGLAWIQPPAEQMALDQGPLTVWVTGRDPRRAYVRVTLEGPAGTAVAGARNRRLPDGRVEACLLAPGRGPRRVASGEVTPAPPPVGPPLEEYGNAPVVAKTIRLVAVRASPTPCARERT